MMLCVFLLVVPAIVLSLMALAQYVSMTKNQNVVRDIAVAGESGLRSMLEQINFCSIP